ncbi:universal stress protein [Polaribacter uvawellassae]|uniref:universal stress protein n=1 Tax=Polaribacter uvawellassae TaxID=3133495 RepID=UPI003219F6BE
MKNILVPIGSSENSINTLQYAIDFANEIDAKIFVLRAYNVQPKAGTIINIDGILERESNLYLRSIINSANRKGKDIQLITAKGNVLDSIETVEEEIGIDLIVMGPKSNSIKEEVFLGSTSGSVVKKSNIPVLIVPESYIFKPFNSVLTAFKTGIVNKKKALDPLKFIKNKFNPVINMLLVKTPTYTDEDLVLDTELESLKSSLTITENATTFQGVLEHFQSNQPDMLCVFRRKRGFFNKLWEKNTILKEEFYCNVPLLVLGGKQ